MVFSDGGRREGRNKRRVRLVRCRLQFLQASCMVIRIHQRHHGGANSPDVRFGVQTGSGFPVVLQHLLGSDETGRSSLDVIFVAQLVPIFREAAVGR